MIQENFLIDVKSVDIEMDDCQKINFLFLFDILFMSLCVASMMYNGIPIYSSIGYFSSIGYVLCFCNSHLKCLFTFVNILINM